MLVLVAVSGAPVCVIVTLVVLNVVSVTHGIAVHVYMMRLTVKGATAAGLLPREVVEPKSLR